MKITFTENHQSPASGNELYKAGTQADLRRGDELVEQGVAYEGWGDAPEDELPSLDELDLSERTVDLLRENGYDDVSTVSEATDEDLLAVDGIGPATLTDIRNAVAEAM